MIFTDVTCPSIPMQILLWTSAEPLPLWIAGISPESLVTVLAGTRAGALDRGTGRGGAGGECIVGPGCVTGVGGSSALVCGLTAEGSGPGSRARSSGSTTDSRAAGVRAVPELARCGVRSGAGNVVRATPDVVTAGGARLAGASTA